MGDFKWCAFLLVACLWTCCCWDVVHSHGHDTNEMDQSGDDSGFEDTIYPHPPSMSHVSTVSAVHVPAISKRPEVTVTPVSIRVSILDLSSSFRASSLSLDNIDKTSRGKCVS